MVPILGNDIAENHFANKFCSQRTTNKTTTALKAVDGNQKTEKQKSRT